MKWQLTWEDGSTSYTDKRPDGGEPNISLKSVLMKKIMINVLPGRFSDVYSDVTLPGQVDLTNVSATGTSSVKLTWQSCGWDHRIYDLPAGYSRPGNTNRLRQ